jgi:hypothetical protein
MVGIAVLALVLAVVFISSMVTSPVRTAPVLPSDGLNGAEVSAAKRVYAPQEPVVVQFFDLPGNPQDWITIVPASALPNTYQQWFYTQGQKTGEMRFTGLAPGDYEIRVYYDWPRGGYTVQGKYGFQVAADPPGVPAPAETFPVKLRLLYDGEPFYVSSDIEVESVIYHQDLKKNIQTTSRISGEFIEYDDIPGGRAFFYVTINHNPKNPNRFPGDYIKWSVEALIASPHQIVAVDLAQILHMTLPYDNGITMKHRGSSTCSDPPVFDGSVEFAWDSLGDGVRYQYLVGKTDCAQHIYHEGSEVQGETSDTRVVMDLPPSGPDEKYSLHIKAWREDQLIGRLYVHDEGGSDWNFGFRIREKPSETFIHGRIFFDGQPLEGQAMPAPYFWFRNEEHNRVENPTIVWKNGGFNITDLPVGRMGMNVTVNLNPNNPANYPGDLYSWTPFQVEPGENPDLRVEMKKVIHMMKPQDNGRVMDKWGASCMEKPEYSSPVEFEWEPLAVNAVYTVKIWRMNCLNNYNSSGTVFEKDISTPHFSAQLPPSQVNECYALNIHAHKDGNQIGLLMTHGERGLGWDYRFRVTSVIK